MSTDTRAGTQAQERPGGLFVRLGGDDRQILRLAVPALGALAAEPLYVLVDTGIVGHLGVDPLAALALAGAALAGAVGLCNFLAYASTPKVGRLHAAGRAEQAAHLGCQAILLATLLGVVLAVVVALAAGAILAVLGAHAQISRLASLYMRIAGIGLPFALIAIAGQGYLRGVSRLRLPLVLLLAGNLLNVGLELLFVFGLHEGIAGSAWATVIAQAVMAAGFLAAIARAATITGWRIDWSALRELTSTGGEIFVRTGSLFAAFLLAGAILARTGASALAAHQIAFQLWMFLALALDAFAIAGQVLVSQHLGAGDRHRARELGSRTIVWSVLVGVVFATSVMVLASPLPRVFTDSTSVLSEAHAIWPIFAFMQPANAAVFALDGILIGAGDTRYLMWAMFASSGLVFAPLAVGSLLLGWGIEGVWLAILAFLIARLVTCGLRYRGDRWAVTGTSR
jgi:putative MATE family efflux protein